MNQPLNAVTALLADILFEGGDPEVVSDLEYGAPYGPFDYEMGSPSPDELNLIDRLIREVGVENVMSRLEALANAEAEKGGFSDFFKKLKAKAAPIIKAVQKNPLALIDPTVGAATIYKNVKRASDQKKERDIERKIQAKQLEKTSGAPSISIAKDDARKVTRETGLSYLQVGQNSTLQNPPIQTSERVNPRFFKTVSKLNYAWYPCKPIIKNTIIPLGGVLALTIQPEDSGDKVVFNAISLTYGSNDFQQAAGATYVTRIHGFDVCGRAFDSQPLRQNLSYNNTIGSLMVVPWKVVNTRPFMDCLAITKDYIEKFASFNDSTGNPCVAIANNVALTIDITGTEKAAVTVQLFTVDNDISEKLIGTLS